MDTRILSKMFHMARAIDTSLIETLNQKFRMVVENIFSTKQNAQVRNFTFPYMEQEMPALSDKHINAILAFFFLECSHDCFMWYGSPTQIMGEVFTSTRSQRQEILPILNLCARKMSPSNQYSHHTGVKSNCRSLHNINQNKHHLGHQVLTNSMIDMATKKGIFSCSHSTCADT